MNDLLDTSRIPGTMKPAGSTSASAELAPETDLPRPRVFVLGDLIVDRYVWGDAERVSPEAPVMVLRSDHCEMRLGGAAGVAAMLRGLEAEVVLAGVIGNDGEGRALGRLLADDRIDATCVVADPDRPTTLKERFLGRAANRHPHQMLRVDRESRQPVAESMIETLERLVIARLPECQALLISDYGKGVCTPELLTSVIRAARHIGLPILVDPAAGADCSRYSGANILIPNRREAELAAGRRILSPDDGIQAGQSMRVQAGVEAVVVKLDRDGMVLVDGNSMQAAFPTRPRAVYDVTGAGDMVLAILGICLAGGMDLSQAIPLANAGAGLEVERWGAVSITRDELLVEVRRHSGRVNPVGNPTSSKIISLAEMESLAGNLRRDGRSVVLSNGCFDLLHVGHVRYLEEASRLGDILVVAVNSDASVRRLKGPTRPVIREEDRMAMLAALGCVRYVLSFSEPTPHALLERVRPDVLVKGGTYTVDEVVGREVVTAYGGEVRVVGMVPGVSTTEIVQTIHDRQAVAAD